MSPTPPLPSPPPLSLTTNVKLKQRKLSKTLSCFPDLIIALKFKMPQLPKNLATPPTPL